MGDDQCGALGLDDEVRHRERLAGAGDAQEGLAGVAGAERRIQFGDGCRLIAHRLVR